MIANFQKTPSNFADYESLYPNGDYTSGFSQASQIPDIATPPTLRADSKTPGGAKPILAPSRPIHSQTVPFVPKPDYQQQVNPLKVEPRLLLNRAKELQKEQSLESLARRFFTDQEEKRLKREIENYKEKGIPPPPMGSDEVSAVRNAPNFRLKDNEIRDAFMKTLTVEKAAQAQTFDQAALRRRQEAADEDLGVDGGGGGGFESKENEEYDNLMEVEPIVALPAGASGAAEEEVRASRGRPKLLKGETVAEKKKVEASRKKQEKADNQAAIERGQVPPYPERLSIAQKQRFGFPLSEAEQRKVMEEAEALPMAEVVKPSEAGKKKRVRKSKKAK